MYVIASCTGFSSIDTIYTGCLGSPHAGFGPVVVHGLLDMG